MKSLSKALDILEIFLEAEKNELRLTDIVKASGINKSTVNRVVSLLVERGYLTQKEKWGKYSIGTKFLVFSGALRKHFQNTELIKSYLNKLNEVVNESAMFASWDGKNAFYREVVSSDQPFRLVPDENRIIPLYCTAIGKVILSDKSESELAEYLSRTQLYAHTDQTIRDEKQLKKELAVIRAEEIAYDDEEWFTGVRSVASGIRDERGRVVGCLGVIGHSGRLSREKIKEIAPTVKKYAKELTLAIGHSSHY